MARIAIVAGLTQSLVNFRGPLIAAMLADGHSVDALGPSPDSATLDWLRERGVTFHEIPLSRTGIRPTQDIATFKAILSVFARLKPDVAIAYTIKPIIYGLLAARLARVPRRFAMITGLGYAFTDGAKSFKRRIVGAAARNLYRAALAQAETVAFQNPDDLAVFQTLGLLSSRSTTGIVNGSGVDTRRFALEPLPAEPVFLMISRLVADKGVGEFVAAAKQVKTKLPDARFVLVGPRDSNPAAMPEGVIEEAVSAGVIEYRGEVADVRPSLAACSAYVLPSYREGTPRSVLEAMAMGRPIITTDAPGCRETVRDGINGLLVPVKAVDQLAHAMQTLATAPRLRQQMGEAGRRIAVDRYEADAVARSILNLFAIKPD